MWTDLFSQLLPSHSHANLAGWWRCRLAFAYGRLQGYETNKSESCNQLMQNCLFVEHCSNRHRKGEKPWYSLQFIVRLHFRPDYQVSFEQIYGAKSSYDGSTRPFHRSPIEKWRQRSVLPSFSPRPSRGGRPARKS